MAYGTDPNKMPNKAAEQSPTPPRQLDRFEECRRDIDPSSQIGRDSILVVEEIEERKQFLEQMTAIGKRREYQHVISNEIADVRTRVH